MAGLQFQYDANARKAAVTDSLKKLMDRHEVIDYKLLERTFGALHLAEIVECFFDLIRPKTGDDATVFGLPVTLDALEIAHICQKPELLKMVETIVSQLQKERDAKTQEAEPA